MHTTMLTPAIGVALLLAACGSGGDRPWFRGGFEAALEAAESSDRLVMVMFSTDWCSWCRRMERETFADREVRDALSQLVVVRLDAEGRGRDVAARYGVDRYPTLVFMDATGTEVDRILGFLPPERFLVELARIRAGDGFFACLERLAVDPSDVDAIRRAVDGYLERSDPEGAISRIEAFHGADGHDHTVCRTLMFRARSALLTRVYDRVAEAWREGVEPDGVSSSFTPHLDELLPNWAGLDRTARAAALRAARQADAGDVLAFIDPDQTPPDVLFDGAGFAFANGRYDDASDLYARWSDAVGSAADPLRFEEAAWHVYLAREDLDMARTFAEQAWQRRPTAEAADTLSRIVYAQGEVEAALRLQGEAAALATPPVAESLRRAADRMEAGEVLDDRPPFDTWPGPTGMSL
jgi:thioredoxin-related protein